MDRGGAGVCGGLRSWLEINQKENEWKTSRNEAILSSMPEQPE